MDAHLSNLDPANFKKMIAEAIRMFPNFKAVATTLRNAKTAGINDWGAILYADGAFYEAPLRENLEIYDRVGGGDSFASGLIYGLLAGRGVRRRPWRTGHDHPWRHQHGDPQRGGCRHEGKRRPRGPVTRA